MLSVKQGGIKYHFLSLWYDSTWDWTQVSRVIGKHSNYDGNVRYTIIFSKLSICYTMWDQKTEPFDFNFKIKFKSKHVHSKDVLGWLKYFFHCDD